MAAETVEDFLGWTDGKRWSFLFVERATRHPVCALFLELHVVLDHADDVGLAF
jgi:hypothetical protein